MRSHPPKIAKLEKVHLCESVNEPKNGIQTSTKITFLNSRCNDVAYWECNFIVIKRVKHLLYTIMIVLNELTIEACDLT